MRPAACLQEVVPTFSTPSIGEAGVKSTIGKRAALLQEYVGYIGRVCSG